MNEAAGPAFARLVQDQLAEERARKQSLEGRGAALVTASGVFVSAVLAIATLADTRRLDVPTSAVWTLAACVMCLIAAAVCGVLTSLPLGYEEPDAEELAGYVKQYWDSDGAAGAKVIAMNAASNLRKARTASGRKALLLSAGTAAEAMGLCLLAITAALTLTL